MNVSTQQRRIAKGETVTLRNRVLARICGGAGEATPRLYPDIRILKNARVVSGPKKTGYLQAKFIWD